MTLDKGTNAWTTSAAPKIPEVVTSFEIDGVRSKTLSVDELQNDSYVIPVKWTSPAADPDHASLAAIPFRYVVTHDGAEYEGTEWITLGSDDQFIVLEAADKDPYDDASYDGIMISGSLSAGIYQIAIFAPCLGGTEIRQDFTLIVTDGTAGEITVTAGADTITATVIVAQYVGGRMTDVCVIQNLALPAGGSYPLTLPVRSGATRTAFVLRADGIPLCAKQAFFSPAP